MRNIRHLKNRSGFTYVIDTVLNAPLLAELVDGADQIFHLAAAVGVRLIVESPVRTIETNVKTTEMVLAAACKKRKKVFVASTSEVYGKSVAVPFREDGDLVLGATSRGRWSYASSKAIDEFLAIAYWRERRCPTVIGRCFNTVGPRQTGHYGMVVPRFVQQALREEPLTVYGDGRQTRCFTHVADGVRAMIGLMDADHTVGEVYNLGREIETPDPGARRAREAAHRVGVAGHVRAVPRSVRRQLRGHAAPRALAREDSVGDRLGAGHRPR